MFVELSRSFFVASCFKTTSHGFTHSPLGTTHTTTLHPNTEHTHTPNGILTHRPSSHAQTAQRTLFYTLFLTWPCYSKQHSRLWTSEFILIKWPGHQSLYHQYIYSKLNTKFSIILYFSSQRASLSKPNARSTAFVFTSVWTTYYKSRARQ